MTKMLCKKEDLLIPSWGQTEKLTEINSLILANIHDTVAITGQSGNRPRVPRI